MGVVYLLTNTASSKRYVGKTINTLEERWVGHVRSAFRDDTDMYICRAIAKHGPDAFTREVLEECSDDDLLGRERHWIAKLGTHVSKGGYNLTLGGEGLHGYVFSEESKELMRQKALGRKHNNETRQKMSDSAKARGTNFVALEAMRKANTGATRSDETKQRISAAQKGRSVSQETRDKISKAGLGRKTSEATKEKFRKRVGQFTMDGNHLVTYNSVTEAAKAMGCVKGTISNACRNELVFKGFTWRFQAQTSGQG